MTNFTRAIVRPPASTFSDGLTSVDLGMPDYQLALAQHKTYVQALVDRGLKVITLQPDVRFPDSTFVEDTAILTAKCAVVTNPGAASRKGEEAEISELMKEFYEVIHTIQMPGTLDGGDICDANGHFFIGISHRTNREGASQLAEFLKLNGYTSTLVDITRMPGILHLKSGIAYLGDQTMLVTKPIAGLPQLSAYRVLVVPEDKEAYAANCIRVNDRVLFAKGFPATQKLLEDAGFALELLPVSEFEKMDGGLSCLSLRF